MSFISNIKNCENNVIQSTCNGAPSAGHVEGDQTATVGELGNDLASQAYPIISEVNTRKLLTTKRQLSMRLKRSRDALAKCSSHEHFAKALEQFDEIKIDYVKYKTALNDILDPEVSNELLESVADLFNQCLDVYENAKRGMLTSPRKFSVHHEDNGTIDVEPEDSISQVAESVSATSSGTFIARQVKLDKKRAELEARHAFVKAEAQAKQQHALEIAKAEAQAKQQHALEIAKAEAEAKQQHALEIAKAEAEAKQKHALEIAKAEEQLKIAAAELDAEERLIALSERGSSVAVLSRAGPNNSLNNLFGGRSNFREAFRADLKPLLKKTQLANCAGETSSSLLEGSVKRNIVRVKNNTGFSRENSEFPKREKTVYKSAVSNFQSALDRVVTDRHDFPMNGSNSQTRVKSLVGPAVGDGESLIRPSVAHGEPALLAYIERQDRNEYINLASQIGYDGRNIDFVFYENQIRRLMHESPYDERRLEVLRASCIGQPREMVNLFFAPMRNMNASRRIERALDRLRQRYGVSGGLTSEPKIAKIRTGPKVSMSIASLKAFNEDLNTLEVYAHAHDELDKLSGQLMLDTANRLPGVLKRRYLDYLDKKNINLNQPGFESLREFVVHELNLMTSDYAQSFFKSDDKDRASGPSNGHTALRVRQVAVIGERPGARSAETVGESSRSCSKTQHSTKPPPVCFVCNDPRSKHFLTDCEQFKSKTPEQKRKTVIDAARCFNCLSLGHFSRECTSSSKCRLCGPHFGPKHSTALHDLYVRSDSVNLGAASAGHCQTSVMADAGKKQTEAEQTVVRKLTFNNDLVMLRTSAVRVINPVTGKSTLAYAQHDTASQATLISKSLRDELRLATKTDHSITIRTLAEQTMHSGGLTNFEIESLSNKETFAIKNALVVPDFIDDENVLPHAVNTQKLRHFEGVKIPTIPQRQRIDILIGQTNKELLTVLEEREGVNASEPNYVLTRLGPIASGGRVGVRSDSHQVLKARVNVDCDTNECEQLRQEITELKAALRQVELEDEETQPSRSEELACSLVEPNVKVKDGRYEIPVPLRSDIVKKIPNNFSNALERTMSLRRKALGDPTLNRTLTDTFQELLAEGWLTHVEKVKVNGPTWYLPFFVTKQEKSRVVYDGAATFKGVCLNHAVLPGANLLNRLTDVLTRFRLGRFACMADLSKCFFQISIPEDQRDLFRLVWFKDNDIKLGETEIFRFCRHVWGINSSPYIALHAIQRLIEENPTKASRLTLEAIENNRYMDDLLITAESLADIKVISRESKSLFETRGFRLCKWSANHLAKPVLLSIPKCDLGSNIREIDLGSNSMPDSKALGLIWDVEKDCLKVHCNKNLTMPARLSRREMLRFLAGHFDPLGFVAPYLLGGKLILHRAACAGIGWDDELPKDMMIDWSAWLCLVRPISEVSIPRYCFWEAETETGDDESVSYQLHGFSDASNDALACVVYLRRLIGRRSNVAFVHGKSKLVLLSQTNWTISRKELEAARLCSELVFAVSKSLQHLSCSFHLWTDSQVALKWIVNPDLHLPRFVKRRVDKIHLMTSACDWNYVQGSLNPADVGTREGSVRNSDSFALWLRGPPFLLQGSLEPKPVSPAVVVRSASINLDLLSLKSDACLDRIIESAPDLYTLKKRVAYLITFKQYIVAKSQKRNLCKPKLDADYLDNAFMEVVKFVQKTHFGTAIKLLQEKSSDAYDLI